jgi:5-formyltetrahydrofolate cyclo-ligase
VAELRTPASGDPEHPPDPSDKPGWRARLLSARRSVPASLRATEAVSIAAGAVLAAEGAAGPVCCYVPVGAEPGSLLLLDALRAAGHRVLVPVVDPDVGPSALDWAPYQGPACLVDGPLRLRQPAGPRLGSSIIATAGLVLVPALAVDRHGVRLGRGGGWYDRTLPLAGRAAMLLAVVRDDELVARLPAEPHDVLMNGVLTPSGGPKTLPLSLD